MHQLQPPGLFSFEVLGVIIIRFEFLAVIGQANEWICFDPEVLQCGFGVKVCFCLAHFWKIARELLSEFVGDLFPQVFGLVLQGFRPHKKSSPKFTPQIVGIPLQCQFELIIRRQILWPFFSRELCRKAPIMGANLTGGSEDFHRKRGKFAENRTLTDVNRRYFGVDHRFSAVNRR